jgi:hypothetical protein
MLPIRPYWEAEASMEPFIGRRGRNWCMNAGCWVAVSTTRTFLGPDVLIDEVIFCCFLPGDLQHYQEMLRIPHAMPGRSPGMASSAIWRNKFRKGC